MGGSLICCRPLRFVFEYGLLCGFFSVGGCGLEVVWLGLDIGLVQGGCSEMLVWGVLFVFLGFLVFHVRFFC